MNDENPLEKLARAGRESEQRRREDIERQLAALHADQSGDDLLGEALGGGFGWPMWLAFAVGVPSAFIGIGLSADLDPTWIHTGWVLTLAVGSLVLRSVGDRMHRAAQLRWVEHYPYRLDQGHYRGLLRKKRGQTPISAVITFSSPVPPDARHVIEAALVSAVESQFWMGDGCRSSARWTGDELTIRSGALHGHFGTVDPTAQRPSHHSNRQFHQWFRILTDRGLAVVHAQYPIDRVRVSF